MEVRPEPDNPQIPISEREHRFHNKIEHKSTFDFIVVGAGSAGCVCALVNWRKGIAPYY